MDSITQSGMTGLTNFRNHMELGSETINLCIKQGVGHAKASCPAKMHVCNRHCGVFTAFAVAGDGSVRHRKNPNIVELTRPMYRGEFEQADLLIG